MGACLSSFKADSAFSSFSREMCLSRSFIRSSASSRARESRNEIRYVRTVDVNTLRKTIDGYSSQLRKLDLEIQSLNWTVELL